MKIRTLTIIIVLFQVSFIKAQPQLSSVLFNSVTVPYYGMAELSFTMESYPNPHDPTKIEASCEFVSPSGKIFTAQAFFYEGYTSESFNEPANPLPFAFERLTPNGKKCWKIRFTPNEVGNWAYQVTARTGNLVSRHPSTPQFAFSCISSKYEGFIVKANDKFLKRTTGEFFFPVGQNLTTYRNMTINNKYCSYGTNEYKWYIDKMSANNANFIRVFIDYYHGLALVGHDFDQKKDFKFNLYNQADAWQMDVILDYARSKKINIILTLNEFSSYCDTGFAFLSWEKRNPFNSQMGGPVPHNKVWEFFTNPVAIQRSKELARYCISRWGYATNLMAWEIFNEVDHVRSYRNINEQNLFPQNHFLAVAHWQDALKNYINLMDPHKHLVSTSIAGTISRQNQGNYMIDSQYSRFFQNMDFYMTHDYKNLEKGSEDFQNHFFMNSKDANTYLKMPHMTGEWGHINDTSANWNLLDPHGIDLHNSIWSASFSAAFGAPANWFWHNYVREKNLFHHFKPVGTFMNSLPVPSGTFLPCQIKNTNGLRIYWMKNNSADTIYGWAQDVNFHFGNLIVNNSKYVKTLSVNDKPGVSSISNSISLSIPDFYLNESFTINWFSPETGFLYSKETSTSVVKGKLVINIPEALRMGKFGDAVFAIYWNCRGDTLWRKFSIPSVNNLKELICTNNGKNIFFINGQNKINSFYLDETTGNVWRLSELNNSGINAAGDLVVNSTGTQVFYRNTTNGISSIYWDQTLKVWKWSALNNAITTGVKGPLAMGSQQVFFRTTSNSLASIWWDGNIWKMSPLNNASTNIVGSSIVVGTNGHVFFTTTSHSINRLTYNSASKTWIRFTFNNSAPTNVQGNIAVESGTQVFFRTTAQTLQSLWLSNTANDGWSVATQVGAPNNDINELIDVDNQSRVYFRTTDGSIQFVKWVNGIWVRDVSLSQKAHSEFKAYASDLSQVFYIDKDNIISMAYLDGSCGGPQFYTHQNSNFGRRDVSPYEPGTNEELPAESFNPLPFPNPAENYLGFLAGHSIISLEVYDGKGASTLRQTLFPGGQPRIDVSDLKSGIYFIRALNDKNQVYLGKVIIKK